MKLVIVEDNRSNLMLMEMLIKKLGDYEVVGYPSAELALNGLQSQSFDVAIVDYQMPEINGVEFIRRVRLDERHVDKPIVMVTVDQDAEVRMAALEAGAVEFLQKPIEPVEFKVRIRNILRLSEVQRALSDRASWLRSEVDKATETLRWREEEIIERLSLAAGYKDKETELHTKRMARYCGMIARELCLPEEHCRDIQLAAPMHDIGKVGVADNILLKNGPLLPAERLIMNDHTKIGAGILAGSDCDLLVLASEIARTHHERWDGTGYPANLKGADIPLSGRIAAVADVFDALTCERPYKKAWPIEQAFNYLRSEAGQQFDPDCVAAFERCRTQVESVMATLADRKEVAA